MTASKIGCLAALALAVALPAWALDADDVVRMTKARAGDDVIIAQIRATKARFALTADDIVRLKKEGVSDAVLKAMIETPAAAAPAAENQPAAARGQEAVVGTLVLENLDVRDYSVQVDAERGNVFFWKASAAEGREALPARGSLAWRLPAGSYRLTWVAGSESCVVRVSSGGESRAALTRTSAEGNEALYISLFENGARTGGGRLVTLAAAPTSQPMQAVAAAPAPAATNTVIERQYYTVPPTTYYTTPYYYAPAYPNYRYRDDYRYGYGYSGWWLPEIAGRVRFSRHFSLGFRL